MRVDIPTAPIFERLLQPARYKGAYGGRGSAKSWFFATLMLEHAASIPNFRGVCLREIQKSIQNSVKHLLESRAEALGFSGFSVQRDRILTPTRGEIIFQGLQDHTAESIKSLEGIDVAWIEEGQTISQFSLELLRPTIRKQNSEIWISWNPRNASDPVDALLRGPNPPKSRVLVESNWRDNPWFSPDMEAERMHDYHTNPHRYAHIWDGAYEPNVVGALWSMQNLHQNRVRFLPPVEKTLIAIDVATTTHSTSRTGCPDETGIVAVALGNDQRGYVIEDRSGHYSPERWAEIAITMLDQHDAMEIIVETNQGGDMIRSTLNTVRPGVRVIGIPATKSKSQRAVPIASLYNQGRISHVGVYPELEAEMCAMTDQGYGRPGSPNRLDAMVWAFSQLFPKIIRRSTSPPVEATRSRHWAG